MSANYLTPTEVASLKKCLVESNSYGPDEVQALTYLADNGSVPHLDPHEESDTPKFGDVVSVTPNSAHLLHERFLMLLPELAVKIGGVHEAIFVQTLHSYVRGFGREVSGFKAVRRTASEWLRDFPWLSRRELYRVIDECARRGYVISNGASGPHGLRTTWFSLMGERYDSESSEALPGRYAERAFVMVFPTLARMYGTCGAALLQAVHSRCRGKGATERKGIRWTAVTHSQLAKGLPCFSVRTIRRTLDTLERGGVVEFMPGFVPNDARILSYRIDYEMLSKAVKRATHGDGH